MDYFGFNHVLTMASFVQVQDGIVVRGIVAEQDVIDSGLFGTGWVQTSYNTHGGVHPEGRPLRKNYAGIGYTYDSVRDAFIPPKPDVACTLDEATCLWVLDEQPSLTTSSIISLTTSSIISLTTSPTISLTTSPTTSLTTSQLT